MSFTPQILSVAKGGTGATTAAGALTNLGLTLVANTSWTPTLAFGGGSTGITYSSRIGSYAQVGSLVVFFCEIILSNKGSSTGSATITGFPLTATQTFPMAFRVQNLSFSTIPMFRLTSSTVNIEQVASAGALAALTDTAFTNTTLMQISGTILV